MVRNGVVLYAPGELNLGRTTRLANRANARSAGLTVARHPWLHVGYDRAPAPRHLVAHGGTTDLDNLIPICTKHHAKIHNDGWVIELGPDRELTLRLPDGTIHNTGPPDRRTAT